MSSQDIHARSATTMPMPSVRNQEEVGETDRRVQVHRPQGLPGRLLEWNELRDEVGHNHGTCDNPMDLTADSWTVMRFTEHENEAGNLEWIRKDGRMHCAEPGCLKACPSPGSDREVRQRHRRLQPGQVSVAAIASLVACSTSHGSAEGPQGLQEVQPVFRPRLGGHGAGLREDLPDRRHRSAARRT